MANALVSIRDPENMTPEELIQYFLDRLKEQTEAHHGGSKWIGTGGTSPTDIPHSSGGNARRRGIEEPFSIKVAMERRYRDYSQEVPDPVSDGEAMKRLRRMAPTGPRDM